MRGNKYLLELLGQQRGHLKAKREGDEIVIRYVNGEEKLRIPIKRNAGKTTVTVTETTQIVIEEEKPQSNWAVAMTVEEAWRQAKEKNREYNDIYRIRKNMQEKRKSSLFTFIKNLFKEEK